MHIRLKGSSFKRLISWRCGEGFNVSSLQNTTACSDFSGMAHVHSSWHTIISSYYSFNSQQDPGQMTNYTFILTLYEGILHLEELLRSAKRILFLYVNKQINTCNVGRVTTPCLHQTACPNSFCQDIQLYDVTIYFDLDL